SPRSDRANPRRPAPCPRAGGVEPVTGTDETNRHFEGGALTTEPTDDPFALIRTAQTAAPNFDLDNQAIIEHLTKWRSLCSFRVVSAGGDRAEIEFQTLPKDMDAFVRDLYQFCPDLVDQGTGCVHEMLEMLEETGGEVPPE